MEEETESIEFESKMRRAKVIYDIVTLILLGVNLMHLSNKYFSYITATNVAPNFPLTLEVPKTSICFRSSFVNQSESYSYSFTSSDLPLLNEKFDDIFAKMPDVSKILSSCKYRDFKRNLLLDEQDGEKCCKLFQVKRFRMLGFLCYRFSLIGDDIYSYNSVVNSLYEPRELYHLTFNHPLNEETLIYPIIHINDFPDEEREFGQEVSVNKYQLHRLTYSMYDMYALPSPYETHCANQSRLACSHHCVDNVYAYFNLSHDSARNIENTSDSSLHLMSVDYDTTALRESMSLNCRSSCEYEACEYKLAITELSLPSPCKDKMSFIIETLYRFITKIDHVAKMDFFEYMTQLASIIGIWTGISFVSFTHFKRPSDLSKMKSLYRAIKCQNNKMRKLMCRMSSCETKALFSYSMFNSHKSKEKVAIYYPKSCSRSCSTVVTRLLQLIVLIFLSWQLYNVFENYFSYRTTIHIHYDLNPVFKAPRISICYHLKEIYQLKLPRKITERDYNDYFTKLDSGTNRTLEQMFTNTWQSDLIGGCFLRNWTDRFKQFIHQDISHCRRHFNVKQFFLNQEICYAIIPQLASTTFQQSSVRYLLTKPGMIYAVELTPRVPFASRMHVYLHFGAEIPDFSSKYKTLDLSCKNAITILSNGIFQVRQLPSPYDTNCNPIMGSSTCFNKCSSKALLTYNRIPYSSRHREPLPIHRLTYTDLLNKTMSQVWQQTIKDCSEICWRISCNYNYSLTLSFDTIRSTVYNSTIIAALSPSHPTGTSTAKPVMILYDFLYQVFCCLSFWIGFSFINSNPFRYISQRKRKQVQEYLRDQFIMLRKLVGKIKPIECEKEKYINNMWSHVTIKNIIIHFILIGACLCHVYYSTKLYFDYSSYIDVYERLETRTEVHMMLCLDTAEMLARKEGIISETSDLPIDMKSKLLNRTISSLMQDTLSEKNLIKRCGHWGLRERRFQVSSLTNMTDRIFFDDNHAPSCYDYYQVSKFVYSNWMCYTIRSHNYTHWSQRQMANNLNSGKTYLRFTVSTSMITNKFSIIVGHRRLNPTTSSAFAPNLMKDVSQSHYHISYIRYVQSLLPTPYSNNGFTPFLFDRCLNRCLNVFFAAMNLTLTEKFTQPSNLTFITHLHRFTSVNDELINSMQAKCETKCTKQNDYIKKSSSNMTLLIPLIATYSASRVPSEETTFLLRSTNYPISIVIFSLKVSLFEQFINIGSIIGIWYGVSMIRLCQARKVDSELDEKDVTALGHLIETLGTKYRELQMRRMSKQKYLFFHY